MFTYTRCGLFLFFHGCFAARASSFAGSTSTALFPPNITAPVDPTFFPDAEQVGFPGPTPTGDEANVVATAPSVAQVDSIFPLSQPDTADGRDPSFDVLQHLGNLTPLKSVKSFGLPKASQNTPKGCTLKQVHLLHRHGARYPTSGASPAKFAAKLHAAATGQGFTASGALAFLNTWTYKLGAEILTPYGRLQLFNLGVGFRVKYGELLKDFTALPIFRTTSEARMVDSALHFAAGFFGVQTFQMDYHQLITIEAPNFNNTLNPSQVCPNANNDIAELGVTQSNKWASVYLDSAVKRLSPFIRGVDLEVADLLAMQQLCAYETIALGFSAFCDLFTEKEWKGFEYFLDLEFWYSFGPGNPATSAQGIGYVQELVSRLTQTPIAVFNTSINGTLTGNAITFPLDQPIYVDATHDVTISEIVTAMNFTSFAKNGPLPIDHIPEDQTYFVNQIAPFASNLVGQVLSCDQTSKPSHIRWILNDGVVPLTGIQGCKQDKDGLCELGAFITAMKQRIQEVDYIFDCFANYTIPDPDFIVDGRFPTSLRNVTM